jgi:hypothetical protein
VKEFHFSCGDSGKGPVGFCAVVRAKNKTKAVTLLRQFLVERENEIEVGRDFGLNGSGEYLTVYFNDLKITEDDIDEVTEVE